MKVIICNDNAGAARICRPAKAMNDQELSDHAAVVFNGDPFTLINAVDVPATTTLWSDAWTWNNNQLMVNSTRAKKKARRHSRQNFKALYEDHVAMALAEPQSATDLQALKDSIQAINQTILPEFISIETAEATLGPLVWNE